MAIGDINGQIGCLSVSDLSTAKIRFDDEIAFTIDKDLTVDKILVFNYEDYTYVVAIKRNYIQVYAINDFAEAFVGKIYQVCDLYVTGLYKVFYFPQLKIMSHIKLQVLIILIILISGTSCFSGSNRGCSALREWIFFSFLTI